MTAQSNTGRAALTPDLRALIDLFALGGIEHHRCGACNAPVGYELHPEFAAVVFNSACDCSGGGANYRLVTHEEWAEFVQQRAALSSQPDSGEGR